MFISFFNVWYVTTNIENYIIINILLVIFLFPEKYFFDTGAVSDIAILFITTFVIKNNYG